MKTIAHIASLAVAPLLFVGCQTAKKPVATPQPTRSPTEVLEAVRPAFPQAKLGSVTEVDDADGWIAIGDVAAADFPVGTVVSIVDESQSTVGHAEVKQSAEGAVYAQFYKSGGRDVRVGDVAVKF